MKVRSGFVSNSSTSSYVILGVEIKQDDLPAVIELSTGQKISKEDFKDELDYEDAIWDALYHLRTKPDAKWDVVADEYIIIVGKAMTCGKIDEPLDETRTDFDVLLKAAKEIEETFGKKPKLYTGERCC